MTESTVTFADIEEARRRISNSILLTPCTSTPTMSQQTGGKVFLKMENLQMSGSYKERGALNRLLLLTEDERRCGVIAASAGNHAQGVSYHATRLGIQSTIVMPERTPLIKVTRTRNYGATVVLWGNDLAEALAHAREIQARHGLIFIHPFDDAAVIAGQGTVGLELLEQNPYLDVVVCPIGGGGLIAGMALVLKETNPRIRIYGVEPTVAAAMRAAFDHGEPVDIVTGRTLADGIAIRRVSDLTYQLVRRYVDDVLTIDEENIANAILHLLEQEKTVAEGAGAAAVAALLAGKVPNISNKRVCCLLTGGNIDVNVLSLVIERGLVAQGRRMRMSVTIPDRPGGLQAVTQILASTHANILEIHHDRLFSHAVLGDTIIHLVLETRGVEHGADVVSALQTAGYSVQAK